MSIEDWENDVGPGWRPLVRKLDAQLREIDPDYQIEQVKEKFGLLRYYFEPKRDEDGGIDAATYEKMENLVIDAEGRSAHICEHCGATENVETKGQPHWLKTLCPACRVLR
jgi:hypothetical protein